MPFKPTAIVNFNTIDPRFADNVVNMWQHIWGREDNVILSNTDTNKTISFKEDLSLFSANPDEYESKYGLSIAYEELEKSNKLLTKIQSTDIDLLVTKR